MNGDTMITSLLTKRWPRAGYSRRLHGRGLLIPLSAAVCGGGLVLTLAAGPAVAQPPPPAPGVTMSAAAQSASVVYLAYAGTDRNVYVRNVAAPAQGPIALGGQLIEGPAAVVAAPGVLRPTSALVVFGRGTDNAVWWRHQTLSGWSPWTSLGGVLTFGPAAASNPNGQFGQIAVFARGTDGAIWLRSFVAGTWTPWHVLPGGFSDPTFIGKLLPGTGPAAVDDTGGNQLLTAVGADRGTYLLGNVDGFGFAGLPLGGQTSTNPAVTVAADQAVVFVRGTDNALWYKSGPVPLQSLASFAPWRSLGGRLTSGIAATTVPGGKTYLLALGTDNQVWVRTGTWPTMGGWTRA
jgi:hypothetical protein